MSPDLFVVSVVLGIIVLVVFNPINWVKAVIWIMPKAKRPAFVAELRREALTQQPEIAMLIIWVIDQATGQKGKSNGAHLQEATADAGGSGGVHALDGQDHQRAIDAGDQDHAGGDPDRERAAGARGE